MKFRLMFFLLLLACMYLSLAQVERPETHCERDRDRILSELRLGAFIPRCDAKGEYTPQQCWPSTGECWCVDSLGQEKAGTRTSPGTPPKDCNNTAGEPERAKTRCERERDRSHPLIGPSYLNEGGFIPRCDAKGEYTPQQCWPSTGECWCVDSLGQEKAGTRTSHGTPPKDCNNTAGEPEHAQTRCERERDRSHPLIGAFIPRCNAKGEYTPQQCWESTGYCWCVDSRGQEKPGTRTSPVTPRKECNNTADEPERAKTHCERDRDRILSHPLMPGAFIPQCDAKGEYTPKQCDGSIGVCWCVDSQGKQRTPPGTTIDCENAALEPTMSPEMTCFTYEGVNYRGTVSRTVSGKTCQRWSDQTPHSHERTPENYPHRGLDINYCRNPDNEMMPWCYTTDSQQRWDYCQIPRCGDPPQPDAPQPVEPDRLKTLCEHHRDNTTVMPGSFIPQCDAKGEYTPQQCSGSTGYCWCVDSLGQEKAGTETSPGTPPKDCNNPADEPERAKTHCERERDRIPHRLIGAFIPQCDAKGEYTPQQCHGSTGHCWCVNSLGKERLLGATNYYGNNVTHFITSALQRSGQTCWGSTGECWCVDSRGQEKPGTRTSPVTPPKDCNNTADEPERAKTHCERERDRILSLTSEVHRLIGAFIPQCDAKGEYTPQQCSSTVFLVHGAAALYCWCVDSLGQEKAGTRTSPGTPPKDCNNTADEPERAKTHCERVRDSMLNLASEGLIGLFIPQCDAKGEYTPKQCHGSTGHCWCVDSLGQEKAGTRTSPGRTPLGVNGQVDCGPRDDVFMSISDEQ